MICHTSLEGPLLQITNSINENDLKLQESYNSHLSKCIENQKSLKRRKKPKERSRNEFLCDICGKVTRSNANLIVHMYVFLLFNCASCLSQ